ncbi:MAG: cupin domain-containing protein [Kiloniellales bacterium]
MKEQANVQGHKPADKTTARSQDGTTGEPYAVGAQIRELRRLKELSLRDMAKLTGRSIGHLSQIERGFTAPSLKLMSDISTALGVQIGWFFRDGGDIPEDEQGVIVRRENRKQLKCVSGITDYLLTPNLSSDPELLWCEFEIGASSGEEFFTHKGAEAGVVVRGALELEVGSKTFVLRKGDSFSFKSTEPHRFRNVADEMTVVVWSITPPSW